MVPSELSDPSRRAFLARLNISKLWCTTDRKPTVASCRRSGLHDCETMGPLARLNGLADVVSNLKPHGAIRKNVKLTAGGQAKRLTHV